MPPRTSGARGCPEEHGHRDDRAPVPHLDVVADVRPEVPPRDDRERDAPQAEHDEREREDRSPAATGSDPGLQPVDRVAQAGTIRVISTRGATTAGLVRNRVATPPSGQPAPHEGPSILTWPAYGASPGGASETVLSGHVSWAAECPSLASASATVSCRTCRICASSRSPSSIACARPRSIPTRSSRCSPTRAG